MRAIRSARVALWLGCVVAYIAATYAADRSPATMADAANKFLSTLTAEQKQTANFAFDNVKASRLTAGAPDAQALADQVSEAFIAFFRSGDPNTPKSKLPTWPRYDATNRPTMVFSSTPALRNDPIREQRLAMWDVLGLAG